MLKIESSEIFRKRRPQISASPGLLRDTCCGPLWIQWSLVILVLMTTKAAASLILQNPGTAHWSSETMAAFLLTSPGSGHGCESWSCVAQKGKGFGTA